MIHNKLNNITSCFLTVLNSIKKLLFLNFQRYFSLIMKNKSNDSNMFRRDGRNIDFCSLSINSPLNSSTNNILLVGNGFDLELGLKTSYTDFLMYIAIKADLANVVEELKAHEEYREYVKSSLQNYFCDNNLICHSILRALDNVDNPNNEFFKEADDLLKNKLDFYFISDFLYLIFDSDLFSIIKGKVYNSDKISFKHGDEYLVVKKKFKNSFNNKKIVNKFGHVSTEEELFDAIHDTEALLKILNNKINEATIKQWVDVENFIEYLVTDNIDLRSRFYGNSSEKKSLNSPLVMQPSLYKEYFNGIELFCDLFSNYLKSSLINSYVSYQNLNSVNKTEVENFEEKHISPYIKSLKSRSHGFIDSVVISEINCIINYNYTYSAEAILSQKNNLLRIFSYHVNGELDYNNHYDLNHGEQSGLNDNHLVFGFTKAKSIKLKSTLHTFEKKVLRVIKNTTPLDLKKLTSRSFNLLIFGHSCGVADGDVIGALLKSPKLKIAVVLCYDQESLVSITNNLIEIVEPARFDELISNANQKVGNESLYFAVRDEFS